MDLENELDPITTWADIAKRIGGIEFDWKPWLPKGYMSLLAGATGMGKSCVALRICATYINHLPWPDGTIPNKEPSMVLWCEAESALALNLNRAKDWNYPMQRILQPFNDENIDLRLDDEKHREVILKKASRPDVNFVVVDSLSGSHRKNENDDQIKDVCMWLAALARDTKKPVLVLHHLNKKKMGDSDVVTLDRVRGSTLIVQFARAVWALDAPDPRLPDNKRLSIIKNNFAKFPKPIGVQINDNGVCFMDAPEKPKSETQLERAIELLKTILEPGAVRTAEIQKGMVQASISWSTTNEAKQLLGIKSSKRGDEWFWELP